MKTFRPILVLLFLSGLLFAQSLQTVQPEKVQMSTERLERIDNVFEQYVDEKHLPGAVALVMRHGKIVHHEAYGVSNIETKKILKKDDLFRIASMTKPITSVALMMLYEECKFMLNDNLSDYIPESELQDKHFYIGKGCSSCDHTGYKGRIAILEIMKINDEINSLIIEQSSTETIRNAARRNGMHTLAEGGLNAAYNGLTTLEEVVRETNIN